MPAPKTGFQVVINHEEQYVLVPVGKQVPGTYKPTGFSGTKEECLAYVKKVWKGVSPTDWQAFLKSVK